jgi:hypothetical protein
MGDCRYCGKSAGFLRKEHKECAAAHAQGLDSIRDICVEAALHGIDVNQLPSRARAIGAAAYIDTSDATMAATLARGWGQAVEAAMDDHFLSSEEKRALNRYRAHHNLSAPHLDRNGHFTLFRMMNLLNALSEHGLVPRFDRRAVRPPFNLMKSEELLWLFGGTDYFEQITRREFRGGSLGVSFRVAKGVYIRPGAFRGRSVESSSMQHTDSGTLGITTKHIYFKGNSKSFRVRLEKIVSFDPYEDGLGIMRDTARAKPEIFRMGATDAWFLLNIIDAVMGMDSVTLPKAGDPTLDDIVDGDLA